MNKVLILGNITKDIDKATTTSGITVAKFTVAVSRKFKNAKGEYETDFLNCVAFKGTADFISKYFSKGSKIALSGSIQTRNYEATDGTKRYVTEILVEEVEFVEKAKGGKQEEIVQEIDDNDGTLPF